MMDVFQFTYPLYNAIVDRDFNRVCSLLKSTTDVHSRFYNGNTPLHIAAEYGDKAIADILLINGADHGQINDDSYYPIHVAASYNNLNVMKILVLYGACLNARTAAGFCPIHYAALKDNVEIIEYLLENGVDVNENSATGTPLQWAIKTFKVRDYIGDVTGTVKFLVAKGAEVNVRDRKGRTPLHYCARYLKGDGMEFLIRNGADIDAKDNKNHSVLYYIFKTFVDDERQLQCSEIVIKYTVLFTNSIETQFFRKHIPREFPYLQELIVFWKVCVTEIEKMKTCIIKNSNVSIYMFLRAAMFDEDKLLTYLNNQAITKEIRHIQNFLKNIPAYRNLALVIEGKIEKGMKRQHLLKNAVLAMNNVTPKLPTECQYAIFAYLTVKELTNFEKSLNNTVLLYEAIKHSNYHKVCSLLKVTMDINCRFDDGSTPLHAVAEYGDEAIANLLLINGADHGMIRCKDSQYPIHVAAVHNNLGVMKLLVLFGACVDSIAHSGFLPIHLAAHHGHVDIIQYLLENGADINVKAVGTPLHWAVKSFLRSLELTQTADDGVVKCLMKNGADVNEQDTKDRTALHFFAIDLNPQYMELFIQKGALLDIKDIKNYPPLFYIFNKRKGYNLEQMRCAQIMIKYKLLFTENLETQFSCEYIPNDFPYLQELIDFWNQCVSDIQNMKTHIIKNTDVDIYTFLKAMFNKTKLTEYLENRNILNEIQSIKNVVQNIPSYSSLAAMIEDEFKMEKIPSTEEF